MTHAHRALHGAGNGYAFVEQFAELNDPAALARQVSDPALGPGLDGLIVYRLKSADHATMAIYNADGSRAEICGNGLRCLGKLLFDQGRVGRQMVVDTDAGPVPVEVRTEGPEGVARSLVVQLPEPRFWRSAVPMAGPVGEVVGEPLRVGKREFACCAVRLGNPHYVLFTRDVDELPLEELGPAVARREAFPEGVNVSFVAVERPGVLRQRTFERGSGETRACGTGAAAAAVSAMRMGLAKRQVEVRLRGGTLVVRWDGPGHPVEQEGPAAYVEGGRELSRTA